MPDGMSRRESAATPPERIHLCDKRTQWSSHNPVSSLQVDLGDEFSHYCILDRAGEVLEEGRIRTTADAADAFRQSWSNAPGHRDWHALNMGQ